jgi:hypothetical protein
MAEERTLGLARAREDFAEEPSKEELQRRLDETRDSISQTVTEIKETVANQVQAVKDTLDWREQFKKRPVAWSAGAAGVGFLVGYCVAANVVRGGRKDNDVVDYYAPRARAYAAQPIVGTTTKAESASGKSNGNGESFLDKLSHTPAYGRVKDEVGSVGDALVQELGNTAKQVLLPALITSITNFIGGHLKSSGQVESRSATMSAESAGSKTGSAYQPKLEHGNS